MYSSSSSLTPSSASPFNFSPAVSTTSSQSSQGSANVKSSRNLFTDLMDAEANYMATLKIIDSEIAPLWMKQTVQAVPEFTELIKNVGDLVKVNRQFSSNLSKYAGPAGQSGSELGDMLMRWVHDLEAPYANYARSYIPNLNNRSDILANQSIDKLLRDLSSSAAYDITLESLFNAPIQQLKYYHGLYTRLLDSADPSRRDYKQLVDATKRLDTILALVSHQAKQGSSLTSPPTVDTKRTIHKKKSILRQEDFFSYYAETGEVSPISSDEEDGFEGYGRDSHSEKVPPLPQDDLANIQPRTVKILPQVPANNNLPPAPAPAPAPTPPTKKPSEAAVSMTYIKPATAKIDLPTTSPEPANHVNAVRAALTTPPAPYQAQQPSSSMHSLAPSPTAESPTRPVSPRAVQVQQAVTPVAAMQAVPQKTNDYFSTPVSSSNDRTMLPRSSSKRGNNPPTGDRALNVDPTARSVQPRPTAPPPSQPQQQPFQSPRANYNAPGPQPPQQQQRPPYSYGAGGAPMPPQGHPHGQPPAGGMMPLSRSSSRQQDMPPPRPGHPPMHAMANNRPPPPGGMVGPPHPAYPSPSPQFRPPQQPQQHSPAMMASRSLGTRTPPPGGHGMMAPLSPRTPPPGGMEDPQHGVKQILFNNNQCEVFHWKAQSWYAVEGQCILQVRLTFSNRSCLAIQLQPSGQLYLNAWITPTMVISQPSPTDVSVSFSMMNKQENYLIHLHHPSDASNLLAMLHRMHHESTTPPPPSDPRGYPSSSNNAALRRQDTAVELRDETPSVEDVPQTLKPVFQCKCKLFVQSETSKWTPMGSTAMRISQQHPSQKMHIYIQDDKNKLVSSVVRSGNIERLTSKRLTFLLNDEASKASVVYLIQLKDDKTGNKIYDYLKTQNASNGW
ncbi:hypothetical protein DM01DRAFT_1331809 [Hesseltinella vesiculosa]|uniref:DH domain-containing protein n=1 Tax=Hesseltinella vesiculosa TaxID=101127 RepID=A0A1X2GWF6_9FUNG|nr:hypothetical protein DM01DRAFT_1331809 [Hesseltinella vesiculosa]